MYRIAVENMLGLRREGERLRVNPCIPPSWTEFRVTYRYGKSELLLSYDNPSGVATGVRRIELDGQVLTEGTIPLVDDGRRHRVHVLMGESGAAADRGSSRSVDQHAHSAE
jgi:cellobiose phosphorylase